jgi:hypothetical protein
MMPASASARALVGDQQGVRSRGHRLLVEQQHLLARTRQAHMDGALQLGVVEGMQGLAELEHDVVGDVDQRADRADAAAHQAAHHPVGRRGARVHAAQDAAAVTRTGLRRIEHDVAAGLDRGARPDRWRADGTRHR